MSSVTALNIPGMSRRPNVGAPAPVSTAGAGCLRGFSWICSLVAPIGLRDRITGGPAATPLNNLYPIEVISSTKTLECDDRCPPVTLGAWEPAGACVAHRHAGGRHTPRLIGTGSGLATARHLASPTGPDADRAGQRRMGLRGQHVLVRRQ